MLNEWIAWRMEGIMKRLCDVTSDSVTARRQNPIHLMEFFFSFFFPLSNVRIFSLNVKKKKKTTKTTCSHMTHNRAPVFGFCVPLFQERQTWNSVSQLTQSAEKKKACKCVSGMWKVTYPVKQSGNCIGTSAETGHTFRNSIFVSLHRNSLMGTVDLISCCKLPCLATQ